MQSTTDKDFSKEKALSVNAQISKALPYSNSQTAHLLESTNSRVNMGSIETLQEECKNWGLDSDEVVQPDSPDRLCKVTRHHSMTEERKKESLGVRVKRVEDAHSMQHESPCLRTNPLGFQMQLRWNSKRDLLSKKQPAKLSRL